MHRGITDWIVQGIPGGGFLMSIIRNDLKGAVSRADNINLPKIANFVQFFTGHAPSICWGSEENADSWRGLSPAVEVEAEESGDKYDEQV
jgi:hypothetical protein